MRKLNIVIDFDGTVVSNRYPRIGVLQNGCRTVLEQWNAMGHTVILGSCRAGKYEEDMRKFIEDEGLAIDFINENNPVLVDFYDNDSRKLSGDIYFDDRNAGGFMGWWQAYDMVYDMAIAKPVIVCIIGESGTGKTTLAEWIEAEYGVHMIESYTDRPKRHDNETGHTFVSKEEFDLFNPKDMIAFTKFGDNRYCCLKKDIRAQNTYVIDPDGYQYLKDNFGDDYNLYCIEVVCNRIVREARGVDKARMDRDAEKFKNKRYIANFVVDTTRGIGYPQSLGLELSRVFTRGWTPQ